MTPTADEIRRSLEVRIAELETELRQLSAVLDALTAGPGTMTSDHEMRADASRSAATATGADRLIPHAIVRICQRWDAEGRHAQAAAVWQRDRWMAAMPDHAGMLRDLPNRLDRSIVRQRVSDAPATTRGMFDAMVIVYAWGWSLTSVGVTRAQSALGVGVERLGSALLAAREATRLGGPRRLRGVGRFASREGTRSLLRLQVPLLRFTSRPPRSDSRPARGGLACSGSGIEPEPDPLERPDVRGISERDGRVVVRTRYLKPPTRGDHLYRRGNPTRTRHMVGPITHR